MRSKAPAQLLPSAHNKGHSLPNPLPSSLPNNLPSLKRNSTKRASEHCLGTVKTKKFLLPLNSVSLTTPLSEGRAGEAWEPSDKTMLFLPPPKVKCLPSLSLFICHSAIVSYLFLRLRGIKKIINSS
jgi:hypothetical protein